MMRKRKLEKVTMALVLMAIVGATTLVFSANENSLLGTRKRILLYEEKPRPDMRQKEEPMDIEMVEEIEFLAPIMTEQGEAVVLAFGNERMSQIKFGIEEEVNSITLSDEDTKRIENLDKKNSKKNIINYKKLLMEFGVSIKQQNELQKYFDMKRQPNDVYFAYEYLYRNYGTFDELEVMLQDREEGKAWQQILDEYESESGEFEPMNFPKGYLDQLMKERAISVDDILIAENLARKVSKDLSCDISDKKSISIKCDSNNPTIERTETGLEYFENLISLRKKGLPWKVIKTDLGVINAEGKNQRIEITESEILELSLKYEDLTEEQIIETIIMAKTLDENIQDIIIAKRAKKKDNVIFFEYLQKKYK
ncbi:hypothetical protein SANA_01290 [Gottschalkiaceae bacterium SANA]|nr:hypothetical protein SANA_01290 [Gottschalkiaceae bacterium SANA]